MRVVLYAEGTRETRGTAQPAAAALEQLDDEELGPAHVLVRRCFENQPDVQPSDIQFLAPLPLGGRPARGSQLLNPGNLERLLAFSDPQRQPDLCVVLVDQDGERSRRSTLEKNLLAQPMRTILGVAIREFEAWLIADTRTVSDALGSEFPTSADPETMRPGEAKSLFLQAVGDAGQDEVRVRQVIAANSDLDLVASRCPAFETFRRDLNRALSPS